MIKNKLKYYKKLSSLGVFSTGKSLTSNLIYKNYLSSSFKSIYYIASQKLIKSFLDLMPVIKFINNLNYVYLFIDLKKTNVSSSNELYKILNKFNSFVIYDWAFGIISNFYNIELENYTYSSDTLPTITFLLNLSGQYEVILNELKVSSILSIGLIPFNRSDSVDYPILIGGFDEYSHVFLKFFFKILGSNQLFLDVV